LREYQSIWGLKEKYIRGRAFARMEKVRKVEAISSLIPPVIAFPLQTFSFVTFLLFPASILRIDNRQ